MTRIIISNKLNHKTNPWEEIIKNKLLKINYDKAKIKPIKRIVYKTNITNKIFKEIIINNQLMINSNNKINMPIKTWKRV